MLEQFNHTFRNNAKSIFPNIAILMTVWLCASGKLMISVHAGKLVTDLLLHTVQELCDCKKRAAAYDQRNPLESVTQGGAAAP